MGKQIYGYGPEEHEYSVKVPAIHDGEGDITIYISAHGGGTVGKAYAGNGWDYLVTADGRTVLEGSDIRSPAGRAVGHAETARSLAAFLSAAGESFAMHGDDSEYAGDSAREAEYSDEEREWLASVYERFAALNSPAPLRLYVPLWEERRGQDTPTYVSKLYPRSFTSAREWLADEIKRNKARWAHNAEELIMYGVVETEIRLAHSYVHIACGMHTFILRLALDSEIREGKAHGDTSQFA